MPQPRPPQKPWPLKWVALVIILCLAGYTYLTLHFRRHEPAYQPYHDTKERMTLSRLHTAGYERIFARAERPAESAANRAISEPFAEVTSAPGGLIPELKQTLVDQPELPVRISAVRASQNSAALLPYTIQFTCNCSDEKEMLSGTYVYLKDDSVVIVPTFEKIEGDLLARTRDSVVQVTLPPGSLSPGVFHFNLIGATESKRWDIQVH